MIILLAVLAAPIQNASDWYALLQTRHTWECSADFLISGGISPVMAGGLPLGASGSLPPDLPWPDASVTDPLESGVWGGGRWNTSLVRDETQDSLSLSKIGLIQNTRDRSRYSFELDRPLPWSIGGNFYMTRDDTVSLHSALLTRGGLNLRLTGWEGSRYGWGAWTGWESENFYARTGFSRLYADDRRPEALLGYKTSMGALSAEIGGAASYSDSVGEFKGVSGLSLPLGNCTITAAGDVTGDETGFWGGISFFIGEMLFSALHSRPGGEKSFQEVSVRHSDFTLIGMYREELSLAADAEASLGAIRGKAAAVWFTETDSLELNCHALLGYSWYRARLEAGPRVTATMDSSGEWQSVIDCVAGFTLRPFSLAAGIENITDSSSRSWSFGITWAFTDRPPEVPEGEESGRGRN